MANDLKRNQRREAKRSFERMKLDPYLKPLNSRQDNQNRKTIFNCRSICKNYFVEGKDNGLY